MVLSGDEDRFGFWFDEEFGVQDSIPSMVGGGGHLHTAIGRKDRENRGPSQPPKSC